MKPNIVVVGIGGRTGSMFANELAGFANIIGVGMEKETKAVLAKNILIEAGERPLQPLEASAITFEEYQKTAKNLAPDYIIIATRNPVGRIVKSYYQPLAGAKILPALILSQNGLSAISAAQAALEELFGKSAKDIAIIRVSLLNPIDAKTRYDKTVISYRLPIKLGYGAVGNSYAGGIADIFKQSKIKAQNFNGKKILAMERSKLFLNLIGMASASRGLAVSRGLKDSQVFFEEVSMLREYIAAVEKEGGSFATLGNYRVGQMAFLIKKTPLFVLTALKPMIAMTVAKNRNEKPKDLAEIDYYNGEVVKLGQKNGVKTPVNEKIIARIQKISKTN